MNDVVYDLGCVDVALTKAFEYSLDREVILFALYAMQENPSLSVEQALESGLSEWIK